MIYDEIIIKTGDTLSQIASDYGYLSSDWSQIWEHTANNKIRAKRISPDRLVVGDQIIIPLPWIITRKRFIGNSRGFHVARNGQKGKFLRWAQTVFGDTMPIRSSTLGPYTVDSDDDDDPFYWTTAELIADDSRRLNFSDRPNRSNVSGRTCAWRAVLSLASVYEKRVSVFESIVWGIDFHTDGTITQVQPRPAFAKEIRGHLNLLRTGSGQTQTFKSGGWTFREAPTYL